MAVDDSEFLNGVCAVRDCTETAEAVCNGNKGGPEWYDYLRDEYDIWQPMGLRIPLCWDHDRRASYLRDVHEREPLADECIAFLDSLDPERLDY
jgi:hypothetical protein